MEEKKDVVNPGVAPSFIQSFSKLSTELTEARMSSPEQDPTPSTSNSHVPTGESEEKAIPENPVLKASTEKDSPPPEKDGSAESPSISQAPLEETSQSPIPQNFNPNLNSVTNTANYVGAYPYQPYHYQYQYPYPMQTPYPYYWSPPPGQAPAFPWSGNPNMTGQPPQIPQSSYAQAETATPETTSEESESDAETVSDSSTSSDSNTKRKSLKPKRNNAKLNRSKSTPSKGKKKVEVPSKPSVVTNPNQLNALGTYQKLSQSKEAYRMIAKYARNSAGEDADVEIRNIYGLSSSTPAAATASPLKSFFRASLTPKKDQLDLLLWFKTSPGSVEHLSKRADKCVAFYDRIVRAFAQAPDEFGGGTLRQILVLCAVSLGKPLKSDQGYHHWRSKRLKPGYDSVHAVGRLHPDWEDSREVNSVLVPCGKTQVKRRRSGNTPLKYSEYLVFEASKITPLYAVDVKITSKVIASSSSESD